MSNIISTVRFAAVAALAASTLGACATKGYVNRSVAAEADARTAAINTERGERIQGDEALRSDITSLRTDINALRSDLTALRDEFGARISAVEGQVKFIMPVHFNFDDAAVRPADRAALERFAQVANTHYRGSNITIEGFADPAGSVEYNLRLSRERADAVRDFLVSLGLDGSSINTVGYGKARLVRNAQRDEPGAELNRRVTFVIETPASATAAALTAD